MSVNEDPSTWRLVTSGGIPFKIVSRTGSFEAENAESTDEYIIEASQLEAFVTEGFPDAVDMGDYFYYPLGVRLPGFPSLRLKNLAWKANVEGKPIDPFGVDPGAPDNTYSKFLRITAKFGTSPENDKEMNPFDPKTFLEISKSAAGEYLVGAVRGSSVWTELTYTDPIFGGDTVVVEEEEEIIEVDVGLGVTSQTVEWNMNWPRVPYDFYQNILIPRMRDRMGSVNESTFPLMSDAPPETILFLGYTAKEEHTHRGGFTGTSPVSLNLKFLEKNFKHTTQVDITPDESDDSGGDTDYTVQVTHNHYYRPGVGWRRVHINGNNVYDSTDLNKIFVP